MFFYDKFSQYIKTTLVGYKISINKNKEKYFYAYFYYFYLLIFYNHELLILYSIAQLVNLLTNKIQNKNPARKYAILADFTML